MILPPFLTRHAGRRDLPPPREPQPPHLIRRVAPTDSPCATCSGGYAPRGLPVRDEQAPSPREDSEMPIDRDTLFHTARLARLNLDLLPEEEVNTLAGQMQRIIAHVDRLTEVDVEGIPAASQPFDLDLPLRDDEPQSTPGAESVLANAPARDDAHFLVPRVVGDGD